MTRVSTKIQEEAIRALQDAREKIRQQMSMLNRNASGHAVKSLRVQAEADGATLWGAEYYKYMQEGRAGGRVPRDFADIIYQWSIDKGIQVEPKPYKRGRGKYSPEERGRWEFAQAVAHRIAKSGTLLHREGGHDDIYDTAISTAIEEVQRRMIAEAYSEVTDQFKKL